MKQHISKTIQEFYPRHTLPVDKKALEEIIHRLFNILFPVCLNAEGKNCDRTLSEIYETLLNNLENIKSVKNPVDKVSFFFEQLPRIHEKLYKDAEAFYKNDPAAYSVEEVILTYPGFYALAVHRMAHILHKMKIPIIPRLWAEYAHTKGGIDIHPGATIGERFFLDHATGVVIGETCIIGNDVKVYQNVTLGALHVAKSMQNKKRHPTIQDNVIIYSGATILGGETIIGHDTTIGGSVWITQSIEPFSLVYHTHQMRQKTAKDFIEPINFII